MGAYVAMSSDLRRKKWMREGLVQAKSKSFWAPFTGMTADSVVVQENNESAKEGHTIVFDYDGNLAGKAIKGKDTAFGKGEQKKKFSNTLTVDRYRLVVDNGDAFDAVDIGDLSLSQHSDSREKLGDLFIRWKDQALFDTAQGLKGQAPTHILQLGSTFGYNTLLDIEKNIKMSRGFQANALSRAPIHPYRTSDGRAMWLFVVDTAMATLLKKDALFQGIMQNADVRGNDNMLIKGVIGKLGNLWIVEADTFFGQTDTVAPFGLNGTSVEISGLRLRDSNNVWSGTPGYDPALAQTSRGLILGANALQLGMGKMPDYKWQPSEDFAIKSESALEVWMETQKTRLLSESTDYSQAKLAGYDFGVIAVDVVTAAAA